MVVSWAYKSFAWFERRLRVGLATYNVARCAWSHWKRIPSFMKLAISCWLLTEWYIVNDWNEKRSPCCGKDHFSPHCPAIRDFIWRLGQREREKMTSLLAIFIWHYVCCCCCWWWWWWCISSNFFHLQNHWYFILTNLQAKSSPPPAISSPRIAYLLKSIRCYSLDHPIHGH